jgi:hypothetical protein
LVEEEAMMEGIGWAWQANVKMSERVLKTMDLVEFYPQWANAATYSVV